MSSFPARNQGWVPWAIALATLSRITLAGENTYYPHFATAAFQCRPSKRVSVAVLAGGGALIRRLWTRAKLLMNSAHRRQQFRFGSFLF